MFWFSLIFLDGRYATVNQQIHLNLIQQLNETLTTFNNGDSEKSFLILPVDSLGLANRLRIISGFYSIATVEKYTLIVIWIPSDDCTTDFYSIFTGFAQSNIALISYPYLPPKSLVAELDIVLRNYLKSYSSMKSLSFGILFPTQYVVHLSDDKRRIILVYTRGSHSPAALSCDEHLFTKSLFYQGLVLAPPVQSIVDEIKFKHFAGSKLLIGVHIRAFDAQFDWSVATPALTSEEAKKLHPIRFDEASPLWAFVSAMESILKIRPAARFFICSNSYEVKQLLLAHFGSAHILTLIDAADPGQGQEDGQGKLLWSDRTSERGMQLAAAEFVLLGSTVGILHTRGSSFAREAAAMRTIPVIDVSIAALTSVSILLYFFTTVGHHRYSRGGTGTLLLFAALRLAALRNARIHRSRFQSPPRFQCNQ